MKTVTYKHRMRDKGCGCCKVSDNRLEVTEAGEVLIALTTNAPTFYAESSLLHYLSSVFSWNDVEIVDSNYATM